MKQPSGLLQTFNSPWPATHLLILGFATAKLLVAPWLDLSHHEAHYALYGFYLDLSYVDHPPLAGWLQALVIRFADSELALRLIPIALSTTTLYLLAAITRRLYPQESPWLGFLSVLLLQGTLILHLSMGMAPDVPLATLSLLSLWLTQRVLRANRWRDWLALGLILGLAGLTKYTAITLAISVLLALVLAGQTRLLRQSKPWLSAAIAALLISPVFIWNWQHQWLSFNYQSGYQLGDDTEGIVWSLTRAFHVHLEQIVDYSPLIYFGGIAAVAWSLRRLDPSSRLLLVFSLPVLGLFCWAAGLDGEGAARPHWTFVGWLFLTPLIARWLVTFWWRREVRVFAWVSAAYSVTLVLLLHLMVVPIGLLPDFKHPIRAVTGWKEAAARAEALRRAMAADTLPGEEQPVLLVNNWHNAGRLAWYARPTPVLETDNRLSQYTFWFGEIRPGMRGILVLPSRKHDAPKHPVRGFSCDLLDRDPVHHGSTLVYILNFYQCESEASAG